MTRLSSLALSLRHTPVLVTGASGRIGRRLVEILAQAGVPARVLTRNAGHDWPAGIEVVVADLLRPETLSGACEGIRLILHLASHAPSPGDPDPEGHPLHRQVTVDGTRNLLQAARRAGGPRLVFASSTRTIDGSTSHYARAKRAAEAALEGAGAWLRVTSLRLPPVYGFPHQGFIAEMMARAEDGRLPSLPDFGDRRSLIHVDDAVQALLLAAIRPDLRGSWAVTDLETYSMQRIGQAILKALGRPARGPLPTLLFNAAGMAGEVMQKITGKEMPLNRDKLRKLKSSAWFDGGPFVRASGFRPGYTLEKALPEMLQARLSRSSPPRRP